MRRWTTACVPSESARAPPDPSPTPCPGRLPRSRGRASRAWTSLRPVCRAPAVESGHHLDMAAVEALARKTGAGTLVAGSYYKHGDSVRFQVQIIDAERGTVRHVLEPVGAPLRAPIDAAEVVRRRVAAAFDTLFAQAAGRSHP